jgi:hypothetical protein
MGAHGGRITEGGKSWKYKSCVIPEGVMVFSVEIELRLIVNSDFDRIGGVCSFFVIRSFYWVIRISTRLGFGKIMRNSIKGVAFIRRRCMVARRQKVKPKAGFMGKPCNSAVDAPL